MHINLIDMSAVQMIEPVPYPSLSKLIPDRPLIVAGTFGGPFVVFVLTPLRNALTLASQDRVSSGVQIYKQCFNGGFFRGWTGGLAPSIPAIPQFVTLGPFYHMYSSAVGPYAALVLTAATETMFTIGAHSRNAQMAFNETVSVERRIVRLSTSMSIVQPGLLAHIARNTVGMTGIRVFASPVNARLDTLFPAASSKVKRTCSDFIGSLISGVLSTPFHQTFNFFATTPEASKMSPTQKYQMTMRFLKTQYLVKTASGRTRPSKVMMRDIALRSIYSMGLFGIYATIERNLVDFWYRNIYLKKFVIYCNKCNFWLEKT